MTEQNIGLDVEDRQGVPAVLDVSIGRHTVELRVRDVIVGTANRDSLRRWMGAPEGMFVCDELTWLWNGYSFGIYVRDLIPACLLRSHAVETLRMYL